MNGVIKVMMYGCSHGWQDKWSTVGLWLCSCEEAQHQTYIFSHSELICYSDKASRLLISSPFSLRHSLYLLSIFSPFANLQVSISHPAIPPCYRLNIPKHPPLLFLCPSIALSLSLSLGVSSQVNGGYPSPGLCLLHCSLAAQLNSACGLER